jgi:hypothetical protein
MHRIAFAFLLLATTHAHAAVDPGNWEFSMEGPLQNNGTTPEVRQRCITPDEANDPQKVLAEVRSKNDCQISNLQDSGSEYRFDVACNARVPITGSGAVRYTPTTMDGSIDLVGETRGLRLKTRSFVSGRRLGPCNK